MSWPRRKPPARVPHEDPKVELQLQRILGARERITRAITSISDYQDEIAALMILARNLGGDAANADPIVAGQHNRQIAQAEQRIKWLQAEIRTLEDSIEQAWELIRAISEGLTSEDLRHLS